MAFNFMKKPSTGFHMPSPSKKLAADMRRKPLKTGMPKLRMNRGLAPPSAMPKIKL